jgi:hypothetical protein
MLRCLLQCFFTIVLIGSELSADASPVSLRSGDTYKLQFDDVDGRKISTFDGYVSVVVVVTTKDAAKAAEVGDRVPIRYKGNQKYRFLTIVHFRTNVSRWFSPIASLAIRHRLDQEATRIQPEYDKRKVRRNPRQDLFAVADFDGSALSKLGLSPDSNGVAVFLFDGNGVLMQYWQKAPDRESLAAALRQTD